MSVYDKSNDNEYIDYTSILNRDKYKKDIEHFLLNFDYTSANKRAIFVYGPSGIGKSTFILNLLKQLKYKYIKYDSSDFKSKEITDKLSSNNISTHSVISLFNNKPQKTAIIIDDIDSIKYNDKGAFSCLIKIIRPKKTKRQKLKEKSSNLPIICIGELNSDKKTKELINICNIYKLNQPTRHQIKKILLLRNPNHKDNIDKNMLDYIDKDLHRVENILNNSIMFSCIQDNYNILQKKSSSNNIELITSYLLNNKITLNSYKNIIQESDRTVIGLLWHENVAELFQSLSIKNMILGYHKFLITICYADCIDRITFQKQAWEFGDLSGIIKIFFTNNIFHNYINKPYDKPIRFTKILTKYSTSYNNTVFMQTLSLKLGLEKKDLLNYFLTRKKKNLICDIYKQLEIYDITKLDIDRIYRYIDNYFNLI